MLEKNQTDKLIKINGISGGLTSNFFIGILKYRTEILWFIFIYFQKPVPG